MCPQGDLARHHHHVHARRTPRPRHPLSCGRRVEARAPSHLPCMPPAAGRWHQWPGRLAGGPPGRPCGRGQGGYSAMTARITVPHEICTLKAFTASPCDATTCESQTSLSLPRWAILSSVTSLSPSSPVAGVASFYACVCFPAPDCPRRSFRPSHSHRDHG